MTGPLLLSTVLDLEPRGVPVAAMWVYDPADPFAVTLRLTSGSWRGGYTCWRFARDLLEEGLTSPAGVGDVRIEPYPGDGLLITLSNQDRHALLRADANHARRFLCASFDLVAPDTEYVDWDLAAELLTVEEAS